MDKQKGGRGTRRNRRREREGEKLKMKKKGISVERPMRDLHYSL